MEAHWFWFLVVLSAGGGLFLFSKLLSPLATSLRLVDRAGGRKQHGSDVPLVGGISFALSLGLVLSFVTLPLALFWSMMFFYAIVILGVMDDMFNLSVFLRLSLQCLIVGVSMIFGAATVDSIGIDFQMITGIPPVVWFIFSIFSTVGLMNAFNMIDGIDGLAAGQFFVSIVSIGLISFTVNGGIDNSWLLVAMLSGAFVFFLINLSLLSINRVFLGDAGSLGFGYLVACLLIYYSQDSSTQIHPVAALWCVSFPVYDTVAVSFNRLRHGRSPFSSDRRHLHYLLVDSGYSANRVLFGLLAVSISLNLTGAWVAHSLSPLSSLVLFLIGLVIYTGSVFNISSRVNG